MKKKLPKIKKTEGVVKDTVRNYLQRKLDQTTSFPSGYLCEKEIYSPDNYDKIRESYADFMDSNRYSWLVPIFNHNKNDFIESFDKIIEVTNDWISARMIVQVSLSHSSVEITEEELEFFTWADDLMIEYLHSSSMNR